ncbi:MAG: (4Fe-4S)-binding protein, partial [Oscillospiraceae bacterium]|nr:(4Fe-4S)-binding protein [Oscillospiraceae bacterium]
MLKEITFYYFSPTGGTKKAGEIFCNAMAEKVCCVDLAKTTACLCDTETAVIAAPVFAGRIPETATEKIRNLSGNGKKAITIAVYGNRAYDDALLELNSVAAEAGFDIAASAAMIAQHSMVTEVAAGRPDEKDAAEIADFAEKVLEKLNSGS